MPAEEKKDESESSGLSDILELAASLGTGEDDADASSITRSGDGENSAPLSVGFGTDAGAALVAEGEADLPPLPTTEPEASVSASSRTAAAAMEATSKPAAVPAPVESKPPRPAKPAQSPTRPSEPTAAASSVAPRATAVAPPPERKNVGMWIIVGVGAAVVLAAIWVAMNSGDRNAPHTVPAEDPSPKVVRNQPDAIAGQNEEAMEPAGGAQEPADEPEEAPEEPAEPEETIELDEEDEGPVVASVKQGRAKPKETSDGSTPKPVSDTPSEPAEPPPAPDPEPEPKAVTPPPDDDGKFSSECLLNPNKAGCAEFRKRQELEKKNLDRTLPDKLSLAELREAVTPHKNKAKACGTKHGVEPGTTVRIKLSIEGESGKVISAVPTAPHDTEPVGECIAEVFRGAVFPRFKSPQQGAVYPFRL
jgi:hypothetical protein